MAFSNGFIQIPSFDTDYSFTSDSYTWTTVTKLVTVYSFFFFFLAAK